MKLNKSKYRLRRTVVHPKAMLRVSSATSFKANVVQLSQMKSDEI